MKIHSYNLTVIALLQYANLCSATNETVENLSPEVIPESKPELNPRNSSDFHSALFGGKTKILFRYSGQFRDSELKVLQDSPENPALDRKVQQYTAIGGYFGYETAPWFNTSLGATIYTSIPFGHNPDERRGLGGLYEENGKQESYTKVGEIFLDYQNGAHKLVAGRKEQADYRMVSLSNIRMTPLTHEGLFYENTSVNNLQVNLGHITKMKERNAKTFIGMARGARIKMTSNDKLLIRGDFDPDNFNDDGYSGVEKKMNMIGLTYRDSNIEIEAWNYHVDDFVNSLYLQANYDHSMDSGPFKYYSFGAQYTSQNDVGSRIAGDIDTCHYGYRIQAGNEALQLFVNYNRVAYNENSYDGGTLFTRWGSPLMFNSFQVQDSELAGTQSWGVGLQYDFNASGLLPGTVMRWRYGNYNLPDDLHLSDARQDRSELTFDIRYAFSQASGMGIFSKVDGWSIQFRIAYNIYQTNYDFEKYREMHGYDFGSVTSNFIDARLYLEYLF